MISILVTVISSLISGILGVIISTIFFRRHEERKIKFDILNTIMGYRYTLRNPDLHVFSDSFYVALNQIYVVFNKNKNVLKAIKKMHDDLGNQQKFSDNLITLIKEIAKSLKVSTAEFNDRFFEISFYPSFKKNKDLL